MQRTCAQCSSPFAITPGDLAFYDRISPVFNGKKEQIPPPTHCPSCRWQRRLAWRNERTLYKRKCDLTGRDMFSMHHRETPFPVYYITDWLSDRWDATAYGREFDFSRPFFPQFKELCDTVPHFNLFIDPTMDQNSEYTNCSSEARNCYLISQAEKNEDCYYARGINNCKDCCDCLRIDHSERCYECINVSNSFQCRFSQDSDHCSDCIFSSDCRSCRNCFGCHGLHQKEYHIFNQPVSKGEWREKVTKLVWTHDVIDHMRARSQEERLKVPQRFARIIQCEGSTGDHLGECRDAQMCFDSRNLEHCAYCYEILNGAKYAYDFSMWGLQCELLYECNGCGYNVYQTLFSNHCWQGITNLLYCDSCFPSVKDCFGCFGLKRKQYCILNKQYSKKEYEELVPRIIEHMRKDGNGGAMNRSATAPEARTAVGSRATGSWGEFFPIALSPFAYNEALCNEFFPMERNAVIERGWRWKESEEQEALSASVYEIPERIADTDDSILDHTLACAVSGKPYRIIAQELRFYRELGLPIPRKSPEQRHRERVARRNPRKLWDRLCAKCGAAIKTSYSPERLEIVYCEQCYLRTVY